MKSKSLKSSINKVILLTFFSVGILVYILLLGISELQNNFDRAATAKDLQVNLGVQVDQILPTFLLPEQKAGQNAILEKIKKEERLSEIQILNTLSDIPKAFEDCKIDSNNHECTNRAGDISAIVKSIKEGETTFGFLFKTKWNGNSHFSKDLLQNFAFILSVLFLAFLTLTIFIAKVLSRDVPRSLNSLASWVEDVLADRHSTKAPNLRIREFRELGEKIAEIIERQEFEKEQALIGKLSSGIIHDIRTPLHTVFFATELVKKHEGGSEKRPTSLENLFKACDARLPVVFEIIESTLDGSRRIQIKPKDQDILDTIKQSISVNSDLAGQKDVVINLDCKTSFLIFPHDPIQLHRVFVNLIKNAIESTYGIPPKGTLKSHQVCIAVEDLGTQGIHISVDDSGTGVKGNRQRIFRFMYSDKVRGTGLGLLITKKIIESHEGTISVGDSAKLGGASLSISLPRLEPSRCAEMYFDHTEVRT